MEQNNQHKVVCFGEVLWDILPSGRVPGGAPMNVAYHLHKLGKNPALITRIGIDENGQELLDIFKAHGVCTDFFQVDNEHETGKVYAKENAHHEMTYDIVKPVAWDFIEWDDKFTGLLAQAEYFVFGSLAARSDTSRNTLFKLLEVANTKVLDINLRAPHFDQQIVTELMQRSGFIKMNLAELEMIAAWFSDVETIDDKMKFLSDKFNVSNMVVTMGGDGAILLTDGSFARHNGFQVDVMDTVGSGDSFLAGLLSRLMDNASPTEALEFACAIGAFIATQKGGCPGYDISEVQLLMKGDKIKT